MSTTNPADALREGFSGEVLEPAQPGYDDARRVFNGMFDRRPAGVSRGATNTEMVAAVDTARKVRQRSAGTLCRP
jgi:hypothetical protein